MSCNRFTVWRFESSAASQFMKKAFTLIEVLLSLSLILILSSVMVFSLNSLWNNKSRLDNKIINYITLSRFVRANAELSGKKGKIIIESNKLKVILEDFRGIQPIETLQPQIDDLNDSAIFDGETNVLTYFPDGSLEKGGVVGITVENDTNQVFVKISEWNQITITNSIVYEDDEE